MPRQPLKSECAGRGVCLTCQTPGPFTPSRPWIPDSPSFIARQLGVYFSNKSLFSHKTPKVLCCVGKNELRLSRLQFGVSKSTIYMPRASPGLRGPAPACPAEQTRGSGAACVDQWAIVSKYRAGTEGPGLKWRKCGPAALRSGTLQTNLPEPPAPSPEDTVHVPCQAESCRELLCTDNRRA